MRSRVLVPACTRQTGQQDGGYVSAYPTLMLATLYEVRLGGAAQPVVGQVDKVGGTVRAVRWPVAEHLRPRSRVCGGLMVAT